MHLNDWVIFAITYCYHFGIHGSLIILEFMAVAFFSWSGKKIDLNSFAHTQEWTRQLLLPRFEDDEKAPEQQHPTLLHWHAQTCSPCLLTGQSCFPLVSDYTSTPVTCSRFLKRTLTWNRAFQNLKLHTDFIVSLVWFWTFLSFHTHKYRSWLHTFCKKCCVCATKILICIHLLRTASVLIIVTCQNQFYQLPCPLQATNLKKKNTVLMFLFALMCVAGWARYLTMLCIKLKSFKSSPQDTLSRLSASMRRNIAFCQKLTIFQSFLYICS